MTAFAGDDPAAELAGSFSPVAKSAAVDTVRLNQAWLRWEGERFAVKFGQVGTEDDFTAAEAGDVFLNDFFGPPSTLLGNPEAIGTLGVVVEWFASEAWTLKAGLYDGDASTEADNEHGLDYALQGDEGASLFLEAGYAYELGGRPGVARAGLEHNTADYTAFLTGATDDARTVVYALFEQALHTTGAEGAQWSLFGRVLHHTEEKSATVQWQFDGGVTCVGLLPGRPHDRCGFGFVHLEFGNDYLAATPGVSYSETALEWTYEAALTDWLLLQPDIQYVIDPHEAAEDALLVALRLSAAY